MSRRSSSFTIPGYSQNAVLQLIVASGVGFILYQFTWVSMVVFGAKYADAIASIKPYVALAPVHQLPAKWWTVFTYGWAHNEFFEWLSNMVWLYCFGNILQMLVGYRQVIPVFIYGLLGGAVCCLAAQVIPSAAFIPGGYIMTAQAGIMALAAATITIAPRYRIYLGDRFSMPLLVVFGVYLVLSLVVQAHAHLPLLMLCLGGLATGFLTMTLLKSGRQPGAWMYRIGSTLQRITTPDEAALRRKHSTRRRRALSAVESRGDISEKRIDDILDKIHQRGYSSLTGEEREILVRASKGEHQ